MTFEDKRLRGVFDFACLFPADPAEELRFACLIGESAVQAAADQFYTETGLAIPAQRIVHYAGVQAVFSATYCVIHDASAFSPSNREFLDQYYSDRDWSELDSLVASVGQD